MRIGLVCSAHGLGHVTRQLALGASIERAGRHVVFVSSAPDAFVRAHLPSATIIRQAVDVGICQRDSVTEDVDQTARQLERITTDAFVDALADTMHSLDRVVVDTAPTALEAARRAGVPVVAMGNFDWAWIYDHYPTLRPWAERFRAWQAPHTGWSLAPGPGLTGFAQIEHFGLIGRSTPATALPEKSVLVSFGGFGLASLDAVLPVIPGVHWVATHPTRLPHRPDCIQLPAETSYPSLVAGCTAILTKPGYGILAEAMLAGTRLVWLRRGTFPEAATLEAVMRARGDIPVLSSTASPDPLRTAIERAVRAAVSSDPPTRYREPSSESTIADRVLNGPFPHPETDSLRRPDQVP